MEKHDLNQLPLELNNEKENALMCLLSFPTVKIVYVLFLEYIKGDTAENKSQPEDLFLPAVCIASTDHC